MSETYSARTEREGEVLSTTQDLGGEDERHDETRSRQAERVRSVSWFCPEGGTFNGTDRIRRSAQNPGESQREEKRRKTYDVNVALWSKVRLVETRLARPGEADKDDHFGRVLVFEFRVATRQQGRRGRREQGPCGA